MKEIFSNGSFPCAIIIAKSPAIDTNHLQEWCRNSGEIHFKHRSMNIPSLSTVRFSFSDLEDSPRFKSCVYHIHEILVDNVLDDTV